MKRWLVLAALIVGVVAAIYLASSTGETELKLDTGRLTGVTTTR